MYLTADTALSVDLVVVKPERIAVDRSSRLTYEQPLRVIDHCAFRNQRQGGEGDMKTNDLVVLRSANQNQSSLCL